MNSKLIIKKQHMTDEIIKEIMNIDKVFYNEDLSLSYYKERYSKENKKILQVVEFFRRF